MSASFDINGWIHIVPRGELPNREAGVTQVLDDKALNSIITNLRADEQRLGNRWPGLYMGEEHFIYDANKSSPAWMWGKEFKKDGDGIWARGEVTDVGERALKNKHTKFTSFVTDPEVPGSVEKLGSDRVRVLRIDTVGFTNYANGRHLLTPIANRGLLANRGTMSNATALNAQHAADAISSLAKTHQRQHKCSWQRSWQYILNRYTVLNALSRTDTRALILNRATATAHAGLQPYNAREQAQFWEIVEKASEEVRARVATPARIYRATDSESADFWSLYNDLLAQCGNDRERAFYKMRDTHPKEFGEYVLNSPEAQNHFQI
ncbi:MAG TPA: hypothetical protein VGF13_16200 [Verrucomicrobiae bacterium]|jgi:hypothetical protein